MIKGVIHIKDALQLLESGEIIASLKVWKLKTGDIIEYRNVRCTGGHWHGGTHRIRLKNGFTREFRDITMFEINNYRIYL